MHQKLRRIPDKVRVRAKADLMLGAREINMLQRSLAPKDDMVLVGTIRSEPLPDPEIGAVILAGGPATTKRIRNAEKGNSPEYDYAVGQELGTSEMDATPFFYPGFNVKKRKVLSGVRRGWRKVLKESGNS